MSNVINNKYCRECRMASRSLKIIELAKQGYKQNRNYGPVAGLPQEHASTSFKDSDDYVEPSTVAEGSLRNAENACFDYGDSVRTTGLQSPEVTSESSEACVKHVSDDSETSTLEELCDDSDMDKDYFPAGHQSSSADENFDEIVISKKRSSNSSESKARNKYTPTSDKDQPVSGADANGDRDKMVVEKIKHVKGKGMFTVKKKLKRKHNRNRGKEYITSKGKTIAARTSRPLTKFRMNCRSILEENALENDAIKDVLFKEYWALGDRNKRVAYVCGLVDSNPPKTSRKRTEDPQKQRNRSTTHYFHFKKNGERKQVCRQCFMNTLGETNMFVTLALDNRKRSMSGVPHDDLRGRKPPANKTSDTRLEEVRKHIHSFPLYNSHYTRRKSNKLYLPSYLDLPKMYQLYKEAVAEPVSRSIYEREFRKLNISFKLPKVDTCHKCDLLHTKKRLAKDETEQNGIEEDISLHHEEADNAYLCKSQDKLLAAEDNSLRCYSFDLQQCLPTPYLNTSVAFYKRTLWTFNLTMYETSKRDVKCYMWHEGEGGRGGNQIATCINRELTSLSPEVKHVILYSDTCGGQNKNSHVASMFLTVLQDNANLEIVDHKFMVSGHSHMECDVDHALIEKQKKKLQLPIYHPHDWYQLVRTAGKKKHFEVVELIHSDFLNFAGLLKGPLLFRKKDETGEPFSWLNAKWFRYTKEYGIIKFKNSLKEDEEFKTLSFIRRGQPTAVLQPQRCYTAPLQVTKEKKKDILDLLPLVPDVFHQFYQNLKTAPGLAEVYPDIEEHVDDD